MLPKLTIDTTMRYDDMTVRVCVCNEHCFVFFNFKAKYLYNDSNDGWMNSHPITSLFNIISSIDTLRSNDELIDLFLVQYWIGCGKLSLLLINCAPSSCLLRVYVLMLLYVVSFFIIRVTSLHFAMGSEFILY